MQRWLFLLGCLTALAAPSLPANQPQPNLLLIVTDDHGYGDLSTYYRSDVKTPNLDRFAADGMLFTRMRANCTVCSPTRAALLTGRYPDRAGVPGVIRSQPRDSWGYLSPNLPTLPGQLKKAGYHTAIVGKWHLGLESPNLPNDRGFDLFHGFLGDMMDSYTTHLRHGTNYLRLNRDEVKADGHATEIFTAWAIDYLRQRAATPAQPFFLYLAYNAPHFPIEPPPDYLARVRQRDPALSPARAANVALVEHLDHSIGRVLQNLRDLGLASNTVVAFTADNGGSLPHAQNNDPWRGGKQSHYDGGLRVPFMIRCPALIAPGSRSDYAGLVFDLFPTFLELAGVTSPDLDAISLVPTLQGKPMPPNRDLYFVRREGGPAYSGKTYEALIRDDWKLLQNDPFSPWELYHLKDDPQEKTNLAAANPKVLNELRTALQLHVQRGGATPWQKPSTQSSTPIVGGSLPAPAGNTPGLSVRDGRFSMHGQPYRGVGANYYDLFGRVRDNPTNTTSLQGLEKLSRAGIPFVRFALGGYSTREWDLYLKRPDDYFQRLDLVVRAAERLNIGLIPSFFWTPILPDLVGEPRDQWGNPQSQTTSLMRRFTVDIVTRYRSSPAMWAWEFGNEMNLAVDLPNAAQHRKPGGTERDDLKSTHLVVMLSEFAKEVRRHDPYRAIISGNSHPRPSAWHNTHENSWKADTVEQTSEILRRDNPAPLDVLGIHLYAGGPANQDLAAWAATRFDYLKAVKQLAFDSGRPVFVGEFGAGRNPDGTQPKTDIQELLNAMEESGTDLAAFWVFDFPPQDKDWNVTFENDRAWILQLVSEAHRRWITTPAR